MSLPRIMVAPNGARLQKSDHPELPVSIDEIVACARDCFAAGAGAIHAHIRDELGQHLLDGGIYRDLVSALRRAVPGMVIQITTEAAGRYDPQTQIQVALEGGADMVSVALRELRRADPLVVSDFIREAAQQKITLQYILYDEGDCGLLEQTLSASALQSPDLQLLFVLGKYGETPAEPDDIIPFLNWMRAHELTPDWAVCAFGPKEPFCLQAAARIGGKCRTGFENSFHLSNGLVAPDNSSKVEDLHNLLIASKK